MTRIPLRPLKQDIGGWDTSKPFISICFLYTSEMNK